MGVFDVKDMSEEGKRGELVKGYMVETLDLLGVEKMHLLGKGVLEEGNEQ